MSISNLQHRWHAARLIYRRDLTNMLWGPGIYVITTLALFAALLLLRNYLNFVGESGLVVLSGAFNFPLFVTIFLSALFLALTSVMTIARERDTGTIEVLFYGPIDSSAYVVGKYLAQLVTYLVMLVLLGFVFLLFVNATNFTFPNSLGWVVLLSVLVASDVIAFGIFLSALSSRVRTALAIFLGVVIVLLAIQFGDQLVTAIPLESRYYNPVLVLQNTLGYLGQLVRWVSPFSYLTQGMEAVRRGDSAGYLLTCGVAFVFTLIFLVLAVVVLNRKGVRG